MSARDYARKTADRRAALLAADDARLCWCKHPRRVHHQRPGRPHLVCMKCPCVHLRLVRPQEKS